MVSPNIEDPVLWVTKNMKVILNVNELKDIWGLKIILFLSIFHEVRFMKEMR